MAKRCNIKTGCSYPRANWWKQTLGTDFIGGGSEALPEQILADAFEARVLADGGTYESEPCLVDRIKDLMDRGIWDIASAVWLPHGVKANKLYGIIPSGGATDLAFTRAGTKTRVNSSDAVVTVATGVPSLDYENDLNCPELALEKANTNLFLNSETLSTQGVTTAAVEYTVSFKGTGTITFSGAHTGSLVGTGVIDRVSATFTPSAGTVTCTVTGSVKYANFENGAYSTSWIPTTSGTATRIADLITPLTGVTSLIGQTEGTIYYEMNVLANGSEGKIFSLNDGTNNNRIWFYITTSSSISIFISSGGVTSVNLSSGITAGHYRFAAVYKNNYAAYFANGVKLGEDLTVTVPATSNIYFDSNGAGASSFKGNIHAVAISKTAISDAEAIALTTP